MHPLLFLSSIYYFVDSNKIKTSQPFKCDLLIYKFITYLSQPFPDNDTIRVSVYNAIYIGIFVALFLLLFQPFTEFKQADSEYIWSCAVFGLITTIVIISYELIQVYVFQIKKDTEYWTLYKWLISSIILLLLISSANYIYVSLFFSPSFSLHIFWQLLYSTFLIGIFPLIFVGTVKALSSNRKHSKIAENYTDSMRSEFTPQQSQIILLSNETAKNNQTEQSTAILYIESLQNYIRVMSVTKDGNTKELLIRNTLSNVLQKCKNTSIERCHRSFLVNTEHILQVSGNAQGLLLELKYIQDRHIPVSRKYVSNFRLK